MTTQYTPILKLALPVTGELSGSWGDVVNDNITSMVEQAIAGLATINTWSTNSHTLTTANGVSSESRCAMLVAETGSGGTAITGAGTIVCPGEPKLYVLQNNTSFTVTLNTAAGTGTAVAAGNTAFLFCDGTDVNPCVTTIVDGKVTGNLTVDGNATINGNTTLGNATTDTITATARFNTDLLPSTDNARDLGSAANAWKDLYIDGTATIATLNVTTIDTTNLEVTNIKAKDGTASITIADSTGAVSFANNVTLGDATTDTVTVNGYMGVGGGATSSRAIQVLSSALTGTTQIGILSQPTANSSATAALRSISSYPVVENSTFTIPLVAAFYASVGSKGASATATNWHGVYIDDQTQGTNNYGITSAVSSGTNKWNIYASGTAANYFKGDVGINGATPEAQLDIYNPSGTMGLVVKRSTTMAAAPIVRLLAGASQGLVDATGGMLIRTTTVGDTSFSTRISLLETEAVFNDSGYDYDFRVESDTNTHALFVKGSSGNVGIGTAAPLTALNVNGTGGELIRISVTSDGATQQEPALGFATGVTNTYPAAKISALEYDASDSRASLLFYTRGDNTDSAPTERMRIDSSGNVGIGTSSPDSYNVLGGTLAAVAGTGISNVSIVSGASSTGNILFADGTSGDERRAGRIAYDHSVNNLYFFTNGNSLKATIDSSGNLGLGVTPSAWNASGAKVLQMGALGAFVFGDNSSINSGSNAAYIGSWQYVGTGFSTRYEQQSGQHRWFTAPSGTAGAAITFTQAMTLDASGNLGIGTSSPSNKLTVSGTGTVGRFISSNTGVYLGLQTSDANGVYLGSVSNSMVFQTNDTERARIDSSGNVGIGTSSPIAELHVNKDQNAATTVRITNATAGTTASAAVQVVSDTTGGLIASANSTVSTAAAITGGASGAGVYTTSAITGGLSVGTTAGPLKFFAGSTSAERARIDSSGNLGLGVTPSAWGSSYKVFEIRNAGNALWSSAANDLKLTTNVVHNGTNYTYAATAVAARYDQNAGQHIWYTAPSGTAGNTITFTQAMTLDASGRLLIGTTSSRTNNLSSASFLQLEAVNSSATGALVRNSADTGGAGLILGKSRGTSVGSVTAVASGDRLGTLSFSGTDGTSMLSAATIISEVDGTPGTNDMPGRLVFSTTADGASSPTERARIDSSGNLQMQTGAVMPYAPAPASISTTATLTNANIQGQIINTTGTSYTVTMPLGTTLETLATWATTNVAYDFYVINTASGTITMAVNTGVTSLGGLTIATGVSAQFRIRRTAANTFILYRLG